jgi:hypothetical protein
VAFESAVSSKTIKLLKEPEDKIGEPSPIRGNKFSHLCLEDFKEAGDETFAWESFEKKLSAYSTMVKSQSCKLQLFNQLNIIYAVTYR